MRTRREPQLEAVVVVVVVVVEAAAQDRLVWLVCAYINGVDLHKQVFLTRFYAFSAVAQTRLYVFLQWIERGYVRFFKELMHRMTWRASCTNQKSLCAVVIREIEKRRVDLLGDDTKTNSSANRLDLSQTSRLDNFASSLAFVDCVRGAECRLGGECARITEHIASPTT